MFEDTISELKFNLNLCKINDASLESKLELAQKEFQSVRQ
jgi:hypothetical protein